MSDLTEREAMVLRPSLSTLLELRKQQEPTMRPMLAATLTDVTLSQLRFPMIASPKLDGIRVLLHPELGPVTRKLKPIPNMFINNILKAFPPGLDGEVIVEDATAPDVFAKTTSAVMSHYGRPEFTYFVFDSFTKPELAYKQRQPLAVQAPGNILDHRLVYNIDEALEVEDNCISAGYEGIMLRNPDAPYKFGRSTLNEQYLVKLKRFVDADATIVGFEERMRNDNEKTVDELGYAKRSSHAINMTPTNMLGAIIVQCEDFEGTFKIGSGFDENQRRRLWQERNDMLGRLVKFKYQDVGIKDAPRFPTFLGFRED